ncbi:VOC family protein [Rhodopseudomonas palustris]|uniref:VOC family protein n=1 Tax=Rhodopseudomonas palustris (strain ATCC BAA-98 / CGA009) TaxID=258594 RepID=Q6N6G7_RHOPA|nr:VOC family protein [Rhodopseudomonas palustris]OPF90116.1 glyoxalase [Rhodopseudomonas palustris]PPQ45636.1 glyoxalase [Rhodopseudomonas palustris]QQM04172.1 hypothetical protein I8G32_02724 [Rhodopseudomonas palustris]RJF70076.1 VOC family protein [Rhodopseudomonas palustris]WAB75565.1 VOC family protein [Rhodopseudomonas palustris]
MGFQIDHVVVAVANLDQAIVDYRRLGFTVEAGGEHPGRGSRNALVVFDDGSYFELIAFDRPAPDFRWWQVLDRSGPGLVDYALLPRNIDADVAAAQSRGLDFENPEDGGRERPDGERLIWKTARSKQSDTPFFCGDVTPRALRVPEGAVRQHPNGALGIGSVVVAVKDIDRSVGRYAALFGEPAAHVHALPGLGVRIAHLPADRSAITLITPTAEGPAGQRVAAHLKSRGESPFAIGLKGAPPTTLDIKLSHGAPLEFIG